MAPATCAASDGVRLAYTDVGDGPTILVHQGFSLTQQVWQALIDVLRADYRIVTFDPRGHGASDAPPAGYSLQRMAADVTELAEALNLRDVTLVGHSMGGAISLTAAADQGIGGPFSRLVLLGPAVPTFVQRDGQPYGVPSDVFAQMLRGIQEDFAGNSRLSAESFFYQTDPATVQGVVDAAVTMRGDVATRLFTVLGELDLADRLTEVDVPVLALWGTHDMISDPRWADWLRERGLPNWETGTLANSGHGSMLDVPVDLAAELARFIRRTSKPA